MFAHYVEVVDGATVAAVIPPQPPWWRLLRWRLFGPTRRDFTRWEAEKRAAAERWEALPVGTVEEERAFEDIEYHTMLPPWERPLPPWTI